jgi:Spy/CpxP family protein refolding chaperone
MKAYRFVVASILAAVVGSSVLAVPAAAQGFRWWQDDTFRRELGLTAEQSSRLEGIFQQSIPGLRKHKDALDRAQADFDRLVERASDGTVMEQVNAVESARAELNKARVMMLLRMRRSLTADQWAKFTALQQQREAGRENRSNSR